MVVVDALLYAQNFWPKFIIDVGSISDDMRGGIGKSACGIFTNSEELWQQVISFLKKKNILF